ncbi:hypothetical protein [Nocardia spumae]|uniref:hypothetical protein n=1 Tax=Nocardia spumae TaxID=2887190 RepID=UPI001D15200C|nr:hypothetical protein [Nocardia spumae]
MVMQMAISFAVVSDTVSADAMGAATAPRDMIIAADAIILADLFFMFEPFDFNLSRANRKSRLDMCTSHGRAGQLWRLGTYDTDRKACPPEIRIEEIAWGKQETWGEQEIGVWAAFSHSGP